MPNRPIAAFDIETIPDPDVGRRVFGLEGDDAAVVKQMFADRLEEMEGSTGYPQLPHHRVVTIAVAWLEPDSGKFKIGTLGDDAMDERSHLEGFFGLFRDEATSPRLVSWNGSGFDLPVIRYRSILHGIAAPEFYRTDGDRKWSNYQNRFHDLHVDLMDVLSGYGASHRVGLGTLSELVGLPGKSFIEGHPWEHIFAGEQDSVREYCKMDVLLTLLLYLDWEVHRGALDAERLRAHVKGIRENLERQEFAGWQEIAQELRSWPAWLPPDPSETDSEDEEPDTKRSVGKYTVYVDDNYHYMDDSVRHTAGSFDDLDAAIRAAENVVDESLEDCYEEGMTARNLYGRYKMFGEDSFIVSEPREEIAFSAWDYAEKRAEEICSRLN